MPGHLPALEELIQLWHEVLGVSPAHITPDSHFMLLGGDSLQLQRLLNRVHDRWGLLLNPASLAAFSTPGRMVHYCRQMSSVPLVPVVSGATNPASGNFPVPATALGLWLKSQLAPGHGLYNCSMAISWAAGVSAARLEVALQRLMQRHPVLGSRIVWQREQRHFIHLVQPVHPTLCEVIAPEGKLQRQMQKLAEQPMALEAGLPCRFYVIKGAGKRTILLLVVHHAVLDGWSARVLGSELLCELGTRRASSASAEPHPCTAYRDYCQRQQEILQRDLAVAKAWRKQPPWTSTRKQAMVSTPVTRSAGPFTVRSCTAFISSRQWRLLERAAARQHVTLFTAMFQAFAMALGALAGLEEHVIAVPVSQRRQEQEESSLGCYISVQLCSASGLKSRGGTPESAGLQLQARHQQLQGELQDHTRSLAVLAQQPDCQRLPSGNPVTDVLFAFQNYPADQMQHAVGSYGHCATPVFIQVPARFADYPLACEVEPATEASRIRLIYDRNSFRKEQIITLLRDFRRGLTGLLL